MDKVISVLEKEILKKQDLLGDLTIMIGDQNSETSDIIRMIRKYEKDLEELDKLDKIKNFINNLKSEPIDSQDNKPKSKRGRPKKNA